jgi:transposase
MIIKLVKAQNSNQVRVYLVEGYRVGKKVKQRIIKKYGNLADLQKDNPDILDKLRDEAKRLSKEKKDNIIPMMLDLNMTNASSSNPVNIGSVYLSSLIDSLSLEPLVKEIEADERFDYDLYGIIKFLTIMRIIHPGSKKRSYEKRKRLFLDFDFTLDDIYRSLSLMEHHRHRFIRHLDHHMIKSYGRDKTLVYYDVTNYYFESNKRSDLRNEGPSKEHSEHPIVSMGLYIDNNNYPITYELFKGNVHDSKTLIPSFEAIREELGIEKCIVVADKGLNSGTNIKHLIDSGHGYIFSSKIRGQSEALIDQALDPEGYVVIEKDFKYKRFQFEREAHYKDEEGKSHKFDLTENMIVFYSANYDRKAKHEREQLLEKLQYYIENPNRLKQKTKQGKLKYLSQMEYDEKTGEVITSKVALDIDQEKIDKDARLDGYYLIATNELDMEGRDIIEKYRGLWAIEQSFRIIKSELEGRPIYLSTDDHIRGHFFTCFMALMIERILEHRLSSVLEIEEPLSAEAIQEALQDMNVLMIEKDIYKIMKYTPLQKKIQEAFEHGVIDKEYIRKEQLIQALKKV